MAPTLRILFAALALCLVAQRAHAQSVADFPTAPIVPPAHDMPPPVTPRVEPATPSSVTLGSGRHRPLRFSADPAGSSDALTLYVHLGVNSVLGPGGLHDVGSYTPLCRAPCEFDLRAGTHPFGVASAGKAVVHLDRELQIRRGDEVVVRYKNRWLTRAGGWVALLSGVGAGSALVAMGQPLGGDTNVGLVVSGTVITVLGIASGLWLANLPDTATGWVVSGTP